MVDASCSRTAHAVAAWSPTEIMAPVCERSEKRSFFGKGISPEWL
jgi:exosome complex RNA-binding protein Csl4